MWEQLTDKLPQRGACKTMVALLEIAANDGVEAVLAARLETLLDAGELPDLDAIAAEFAVRDIACPVINVVIPPASSYDMLLDTGVPA